MSFYDELVWRGLIKDQAGDNLKEKLNKGGVTFYWGTDPTADSLHLGHYSSLVTAKRLYKYGHHPILLVGGATGLIGDPRPTKEREIIAKDTLEKNLAGIKKQVDKIFDGKAKIVNNYDWMKDYGFLEFLRDIGKYINVNYMLNKDIINRRLESGITYAEFSYTLMQGYDFLHLYETENCEMQVEGSDQWGNITTGLDLINKKLGKDAYAFTMPLVTDSYGHKFGKSEGNALWLDINKTSAYELYQFLINVEDSMVISYLKIFTFLSKEEIERLEISNNENPHLREAHKALAREIIKDLHGIEEYEKAERISQVLFSGNLRELSDKELHDAFDKLPKYAITSDMNLVDLLVSASICSSKREAREFINNNSISVNGEKINDLSFEIKKENAITDNLTVIRKGKKKYFIIEHK